MTMEERIIFCKTALSSLCETARTCSSGLYVQAAAIWEELGSRGFTLDSLNYLDELNPGQTATEETKQLRALVPIIFDTSRALQTTGDGNCFFNALAILGNGTEALAVEYRLRTALCLILEREALIIHPNDQKDSCCRFEKHQKTLVASLAQFCAERHMSNLHLKYVDKESLEPVTRRNNISEDCIWILPSEMYVPWLDEHAVKITQDCSWTCYMWIIAAAVAHDNNIIIIRPQGYHSVWVRCRTDKAKKPWCLFWENNHFSAVRLDLFANGILLEYLDSLEAKDKSQLTEVEVWCICDFPNMALVMLVTSQQKKNESLEL
ncbi:uncharacterized protein LOC129585842 [Paramacrobiotus metropolitanus]|uniref:uncharacterized protein LOC129585842 n=1 Tax=Paramacrobiotus metropolitanus TaxID=2943436 RepID=UPI0024462467|nr:uncharacterized protein LOC129585842 [Paramacrobiotus metropolitanus]